MLSGVDCPVVEKVSYSELERTERKRSQATRVL